MNQADILKNLDNVFRCRGPKGEWPGRVEQQISRGLWEVYDITKDQYESVHSKDILGLWEGDLPQSPPAAEAGSGDANAGTKPVSLADLDKELEMPDEKWTTENLQQYAEEENNWVEHHDHQTAIHVRRLGLALEILLPRLKHGEREKWLADHHISPSTASRARRLYRATKSEKMLEGLGKQSAYYKFGILKEPDDAEEEQFFENENEKGNKPKPVGKHKKKKGKKGGQDEPAPREPHDLAWFLGKAVVGIEIYRDKLPANAAEKEKCLRMLGEALQQFEELRKRLEG